ncbi:putative ester cyclase [Pararhizobium capsulatum DSM 1112]|uniref:Ester cyclase n=1 Tax=Pararhizobium capsulatum DSM 1112 TaxID=1121113 RepID=A0ABU0C0J5_9HYPH|nr:ester cyclase [Pararhizobium capsulatum]MDQ0324043.1 putative ester cyclase [Pararhizobium capsulatum DSM 1112]
MYILNKLSVPMIVLVTCLAGATTVAAQEKVKIHDVVHGSDKAVEAQTEKAATTFYDFWNTGDVKLLDQAIGSTFTDHTLPEGRPQGPQGPAFASKNFRVAVPDLKVEIRKMIFSGDYVTVHMEFTGHFTGNFGDVQGHGQAVRFIATDLLKITDGKVTDNWHIEDNLTLLGQLGIVKK